MQFDTIRSKIVEDKMSFCRVLGKDKLIFVTKEDHEKPSSITVAELDSRFEEHGLVTPSGDLNWSCPCVGECDLNLFKRISFY